MTQSVHYILVWPPRVHYIFTVTGSIFIHSLTMHYIRHISMLLKVIEDAFIQIKRKNTASSCPIISAVLKVMKITCLEMSVFELDGCNNIILLIKLKYNVLPPTTSLFPNNNIIIDATSLVSLFFPKTSLPTIVRPVKHVWHKRNSFRMIHFVASSNVLCRLQFFIVFHY